MGRCFRLSALYIRERFLVHTVSASTVITNSAHHRHLDAALPLVSCRCCLVEALTHLTRAEVLLVITSNDHSSKHIIVRVIDYGEYIMLVIKNGKVRFPKVGDKVWIPVVVQHGWPYLNTTYEAAEAIIKRILPQSWDTNTYIVHRIGMYEHSFVPQVVKNVFPTKEYALWYSGFCGHCPKQHRWSQAFPHGWNWTQEAWDTFAGHQLQWDGVHYTIDEPGADKSLHLHS